ncbi:hypothetical protein MMUC44124_22155 [Mycolicibacterium mucogenicum DSM 44124]|nr:hypothetical protein MMUC44124_22155 [Mycolicibacterium mucogenicum DSM 44124]
MVYLSIVSMSTARERALKFRFGSIDTVELRWPR